MLDVGSGTARRRALGLQFMLQEGNRGLVFALLRGPITSDTSELLGDLDELARHLVELTAFRSQLDFELDNSQRLMAQRRGGVAFDGRDANLGGDGAIIGAAQLSLQVLEAGLHLSEVHGCCQ